MARRFTLAEVLFSIDPEAEHMSPSDGHFELPDGSPDTEVIDDIIKRAEHNEWAWCSVKVTAKWGGFEGNAYLGGCSYEDEDDFAKGGYLPQMQDEAVAELKRAIELAGWEISEEGDLTERPKTLTEDEKRAVHDYLFCRSAAKDIAGTHVKRPDAFERVTEYLNFLRDKVG